MYESAYQQTTSTQDHSIPDRPDRPGAVFSYCRVFLSECQKRQNYDMAGGIGWRDPPFSDYFIEISDDLRL